MNLYAYALSAVVQEKNCVFRHLVAGACVGSNKEGAFGIAHKRAMEIYPIDEGYVNIQVCVCPVFKDDVQKIAAQRNQDSGNQDLDSIIHYPNDVG